MRIYIKKNKNFKNFIRHSEFLAQCVWLSFREDIYNFKLNFFPAKSFYSTREQILFVTTYLLLNVAGRTHFHSGQNKTNREIKETNREIKPLQCPLIQAHCSNNPVNGFIKTLKVKYLTLATK